MLTCCASMLIHHRFGRALPLLVEPLTHALRILVVAGEHGGRHIPDPTTPTKMLKPALCMIKPDAVPELGTCRFPLRTLWLLSSGLRIPSC